MLVSVQALTGEGPHGHIIQFGTIVEDEGLLNGCLDGKRGRKVFLISVFMFIFRCSSVINKKHLF